MGSARAVAASESSDWRSLAEDAWRLLGIGLLAAGVFVLALRLRLVVLALLVGGMIAVLVAPVADRIGRRRIPDGLAALAGLLLVLGLAAATVGGAVALLVGESGRIADDVDEAVDSLTDWLAEGPLELSEADIEEAREDLGREAGDLAGSWARGGGLMRTTVTALEVLAGALLAVVVSFFFVKDRDHLSAWLLERWEEPERSRVRAAGAAAVRGISTYLQGVVLLGLIEGFIIGGAVALLGSAHEGLLIGVLTFFAAFFPVVGAIAAGVLAIAVTLTTAGPVPALIVAVVAVAVQQLDNDLLAPLIYGHFVQVHPLVVLVALTSGSVLAGVVGAFVAVPLTAMATSARRAWKEHPPEEGEPPEP